MVTRVGWGVTPRNIGLVCAARFPSPDQKYDLLDLLDLAYSSDQCLRLLLVILSIKMKKVASS